MNLNDIAQLSTELSNPEESTGRLWERDQNTIHGVWNKQNPPLFTKKENYTLEIKDRFKELQQLF